MVQRHLVAGGAGTSGCGPKVCSAISHDKLSSDNSVFAHPIIKHYQTFKGAQPRNSCFFRHLNSFYKAFFHVDLSESPCLTHRLYSLASLLHLHIAVFLLMAIWSHWFTLSYMLALDLSSCCKCETLRQCRLFSLCLWANKTIFVCAVINIS